jgi:hypothetical protein
MENIYLLLFICLICWYFIYLRKVSESARKHTNKYCKNEQLQFITIARRSSRLRFSKQKGFYLLSIFDFEFSGDGESSNVGVISLRGLKLENIELPAYRI